MNIAEPFIRRPVATTLLMLSTLIFGGLAYRILPVSDLPNVDFPTLVVTAGLPGASPETMASSVATPLERQFSTIAGLTSMDSSSALGTTQITLQFDLSRDIDAAAQDVQSAITQAARLLPPGLPTPPTFRKANPADQPILFFALTSSTLPPWQLGEYADTLVAQRLSMVNDVAQVQVFGGQKYAVRINVDPKILASRGVGIDEVANAVRAANVNLPTGTLQGTHQAVTVEAEGQLRDASVYRRVIVAYRNGSPVRLEELGTVFDGVEDDKTASWYAGPEGIQRSVVLAVRRQPGTNTVAVTRGVKQLLPTLEAQLPPAVRLHVLFDRSESILESVGEVKTTMFVALVLVVLVIFLFLRNLSATMIPSLALPLSIIGTFAVMYPLGFSVDNFSLLALTLSIGFVVDDAVVMLENIVRHREMGEGPLEAALNGSSEIGFTIISMTISLAAVFIPVLFMPGIVGRLFHEFAVTICVAILISGVVSLTLTPMLCSRFLRHPGKESHGRLYQSIEGAFDAMLRGYERSLRWVLRHHRLTMAFSLVVLALTIVLFVQIPKGFIADEDYGSIFGIAEAAQGVSFEEMVRNQHELAERTRVNPSVRAMFTTVVGSNAGAGSTANQARMFIYLKDRSTRPGVQEVIGQLRGVLSGIPGLRVFLQQLPTIRIGGQLTKSQYQLTLQSPVSEDLYRAAPELEAAMREIKELQEVTTDLQLQSPQLNVAMDRDRASALGISAEQIEDALYSAYGDRWISTIYASNNQYRVILGVDEPSRRDAAALEQLYVRSSAGTLVPLSAVTRISDGVGPLTITHSGQFPSVTLSFNLIPGVALGDAVAKIDGVTRRVLPATVTTNFQGTAQAFQSSLTGLWLLLLAAIVVIYIVLGILYESFIHPLTILSGLPSAGFGALMTLMLFGSELNVYSFVGLVMLIGIVKKNAIMQIDFALDAQRNEGKSPEDAIFAGCVVRFRPIMMTTMAALLGALPIALAIGGGTTRRPLGLAVVGGLLFSQFVTLYLTPVYYTYLEAGAARVRNFRTGWRTRATPVLTEPPLP